MMKIGIDFGTSYTKIAYPDENGHPLLFRYPNEQRGQPYIATEISYISHKEVNSRFIGPLAFDHINDNATNNKFYRDFKMALPLAVAELSPAIWKDGRTPASVTQNYFEELLTQGRYPFVQKVGNIDEVIVSVPEVWYRQATNPGPDRLLEVFEKLGFARENLQLQSEPVCAAAFYVYCQQQRSKEKKDYNLLVCDMGGGTFDVALCKVVENRSINVLYHDGSGEHGLGSAGTAFDQACVQAACLAKFEQIPENDNAFYRLLRAFEWEKINPKDDTPQMISEANARIPDLGNTFVYSFDRGYHVTVTQAWQAFLPIRDEIRKVLHRVQEESRQKKWNIDQIIVVGGFGQYPLVQKTIFDCFPGINAEQSIAALFENERYCAIAKGAFYIVNKIIQVIEPFQHTLGIIINGRVDGLVRNIEIPIIQANQARAGMTAPQFATNENGERVIVRVLGQRNEPMPVYVLQNGRGANRMVRIPELQKWPNPGEYAVGFQIDRSNRATLIFECRNQKTRYTYPVGELE